MQRKQVNGGSGSAEGWLTTTNAATDELNMPNYEHACTIIYSSAGLEL